MASQLASASSTLLYIFTETEISPIFVSIIVPISVAGSVIGSTLAPFFINIFTRVRTAAIICSVAIAVLSTFISWSVEVLSPNFSIIIVNALCFPMGAVSAISSTVFPIFMSTLISIPRQNDLNILQAGLGSIVVILITTYSLFRSEILKIDSLDNVEFLWIGSALMFASAAFLGLIHIGSEPGRASEVRTPNPRAIHFLNLSRKNKIRLYGHTQVAFCSVLLSPVFWGVYSTQTLDTPGSVDQNLLFVGIGIAFGMPTWLFLRNKMKIRTIYRISSTISLSCTAAYFLLTFAGTVKPNIAILGSVLVLSSFSAQPIYSAAQNWLLLISKEMNRVMVFSYANFVSKISLMIFGFLLVAVAGYGPSSWPIMVVLFFNFIALAASVRMPSIEGDFVN